MHQRAEKVAIQGKNVLEIGEIEEAEDRTVQRRTGEQKVETGESRQAREEAQRPRLCKSSEGPHRETQCDTTQGC